MSNPTIELGGGKWATKPASLLAYNNHPEWGYSAKEFTVDRNSTATCVGSDGLIKTVQANEARIDYSNDPNGALLVEPQRTNLIPYSEDYSNNAWIKSGNTPIYNYGIAPDGTQTSTKVSFVDGNGWQNLGISDISTPNDTYTFSIWLKKISGGSVRMWVNGGGNVTTPITISPSNEWVRYEVTSNVSDATARPQIAIASSNGTIDFEVWGAQLEEASTASSLIPTNGTTVTRLGDMVKDAGNVDTFNDSEGTLFVEAEYKEDDRQSSIYIRNIDTLYENMVAIKMPATGSIFGIITGKGANNNGIYTTGQNHFGSTLKCALTWDENIISFYLKGVKIGEVPNVNKPIGLNNLSLCLSNIHTENTKGFIKNVKYYNQALTDQELIDLTTI
jgi:hypothetical protein